MSADPYARVTHDGKTVDRITHEALRVVEKRLGYDLTVTQGSYNAGGVAASAGTHDGGGVVDLAPYDHARKVRELRRVGFAAWFRPELWRNGKRVWPDHIHAVLIGNERLSADARDQVTAYLNGRDGLADNGPDNGPREFVGNRFVWPPKPTRVQRARDLLRAAFKSSTGGRRAAIREALRKLPPR